MFCLTLSPYAVKKKVLRCGNFLYSQLSNFLPFSNNLLPCIISAVSIFSVWGVTGIDGTYIGGIVVFADGQVNEWSVY
jgi:hypothetical protein